MAQMASPAPPTMAFTARADCRWPGLRSAPGGILAIWSAAPDPVFTKRLGVCGFTVDERKVRARSNGKGPTHTIWFAS